MTPISLQQERIHTIEVLLTRQEGGGHFVLLEHRTDDTWVLPGNARPVTTPDFQAALISALKEELNLTPERYIVTEVDIRESFDYDHKNQRDLFGKKGILHLFLVQYLGSDPIVPRAGILDVQWVDPEDVPQRLTYDSSRRAFLRAIEYL